MSTSSDSKRTKRLSFPVLSSTQRVREPSIPPNLALETDVKEIVHKEGRSTWRDTRVDWDLLVLGTVCKVLLWPAYRSTDFEVHRNWMAITHSLPMREWYYEATSEWTLDYPPFFAYFEFLLSIPASWIDPAMVDVKNLGYSAWSVIAYQRTTVIVTELILAFAVRRFIPGSMSPKTQRILSASLFLHPGFLIVDHIHFQYNGFLFGILLWSILMARNDRPLLSGIFFAVLLNFKHIYMYMAPPYFIYLLRSYCLSPSYHPNIKNFNKLAASVIAVFAVSLGPFVIMKPASGEFSMTGQIQQVLSRLFPFKRGLNHAYWAPNFWALLTALDRVLLKAARDLQLNISVREEGVVSTSRGLVGDTSFAILPDVKPSHTFLITAAVQVLFLVKLWRNPSYKSFLTSLTLCGYASFLFGWHVHEKAILLVLVPLTLLAAERHVYFRTFVIVSVAGICSLFPLLFTPAETLIKIVYFMLWSLLVLRPLQKLLYVFPTTFSSTLLDILERTYLWGFIVLQIFVTLFPIFSARYMHDKGEEQYEFLPLMMTSIYCALGVIWGFVRLGWIYLREKY